MVVDCVFSVVRGEKQERYGLREKRGSRDEREEVVTV